MTEKIIGYKVLNPDWTCRNQKYKVGKTYEIEEKPVLCKKGFHFCLELVDCFKYYSTNIKNIIIEVEALGDCTEQESNCTKISTNKIKILREVSREESYKIGNQGQSNTGYKNTGNWNTGDNNTGNWNTGEWNTGNWNTGEWNTGNRNTGDNNTGNKNTGEWNTGNWNTGDKNTGDKNTGDNNTGNRNTGDNNTGNRNTGNKNTGDNNTGYKNTGEWNTGDWNTGDKNTGDWNTGDWNTGDWNTGFFNTTTPEFINVFNKKCKKEIWDECSKPNFIYFDIVQWINESDMTVNEKNINPRYKASCGYLKKYDYKEAFVNSFIKASKTDILLLLALPNFNYKVFENISGISKKMIEEKLK